VCDREPAPAPWHGRIQKQNTALSSATEKDWSRAAPSFRMVQRVQIGSYRTMELTVVRRQEWKIAACEVEVHPRGALSSYGAGQAPPDTQSPHTAQRRAEAQLLAYVILNNGLAEKLRAIRLSDRHSLRLKVTTRPETMRRAKPKTCTFRIAYPPMRGCRHVSSWAAELLLTQLRSA